MYFQNIPINVKGSFMERGGGAMFSSTFLAEEERKRAPHTCLLTRLGWARAGVGVAQACDMRVNGPWKSGP